MWTLRTARGRAIPLASLPATLGRGEEADVAVPHESVDDIHAAVSLAREGGLQIAAIGDAVVAIGGEVTTAGHLVAGDELRLGDVCLQVEYQHDEATPDPRPARVAEPSPPPSGSGPAPTTRRDARAATTPRGGTGRPPPRGTDDGLTVRDRRLQFSRVEARKGLLHADLEQLSPGLRAVFVVGVLLVAAGLVYAVAWLIDVLA